MWPPGKFSPITIPGNQRKVPTTGYFLHSSCRRGLPDPEKTSSTSSLEMYILPIDTSYGQISRLSVRFGLSSRNLVLVERLMSYHGWSNMPCKRIWWHRIPAQRMVLGKKWTGLHWARTCSGIQVATSLLFVVNIHDRRGAKRGCSGCKRRIKRQLTPLNLSKSPQKVKSHASRLLQVQIRSLVHSIPSYRSTIASGHHIM